MGKKNSNLLDQLNARVKTIDNKLAIAKDNQSIVSKEITELTEARRNLLSQIKSHTPHKITISDHAVLRYIERVMQIDIEDVRRNMVNEKTKDLIQTMGDGKYGSDGHKLIVKNKTIVSVV